MGKSNDILISIQGRFVDKLLDGTKRIELRRRAPRVSAATRIWIYDKAPVAAVRAVGMLTMVHTLHPNELWRRYGRTLGLEHDEYLEYVDGREHASALALEDILPLRPVSLHKMRELKPNFHPPQFYLRLCDEGPLIEMLERHLQPG